MKPDDILTIVLMAIAYIMVVACTLICKKISDKYDKDMKNNVGKPKRTKSQEEKGDKYHWPHHTHWP